jgi:C-terminal processing protease CtpA/Prc
VHASRPAVSALVVVLPVLAGVVASGCAAQPPPPAVPRDPRTGCFTFENCAPGTLGGWGGGPASTQSIDSTHAHRGRFSGLITRSEDEPESPFSTFAMRLPVDFPGKKLELRGWLRLENVKGYAGLWQRQDGVSGSGSVQFDNMQRRNLHGTIDWAEYKVTLPLDPRARSVTFGAILAGSGRVWVDDLQLLVDGRPFESAPAAVGSNPAMDADHAFDGGSGIAPGTLTNTQVENLVTLGKVWGFVKYRHPKVTDAQTHWDYDLFRVLPAVLAAKDRGAANEAIDAWLGERLGDPPPCKPCARVPADVHIAASLDWIADRARLGDALAARLALVHERRDADGEQHYVAIRRMSSGNPSFTGEQDYPKADSADAGMRLLAVYRFWNIVEHWFPYRDVVGEDWDGVLAEFVPRAFAVRTNVEGTRLLLALVARAHDGHANLWSGIAQRPPAGNCVVPAELREIGGTFVVHGPADSAQTPELVPGDAIVALDGVPVADLVPAWRPFYGVSNEETLRRDIARALTSGPCGPVRVLRDRAGKRTEVTIARVSKEKAAMKFTHDRPGATFRRASDELAYLKLSSVEAKKTADYVRQADGARLLLIDIRNYPGEFVALALSQHMVAEKTPFVTVTVGDLANPGTFTWARRNEIKPKAPRFQGRVAILVDETSQSQAEYTALALRSAPGAVVVGSTTAGADGNVSPIPMPGGHHAMISGIGIFTADRQPTQRVGILPDVVVRPTREGLAAGRDEVLEAAVRHVLGRALTAAEEKSLAIGAAQPHGL